MVPVSEMQRGHPPALFAFLSSFSALLAGHGVPALPGQVPEFTRGGIAIFWGRAEPIFYIGAGLPGMIAGFYAALRGNFRQKMEAEAAERNVAPGRTR